MLIYTINKNNNKNNNKNRDRITKAFEKFLLSQRILSWKYNIRRNVNSDFSIVTMRRVAIIFFELEVVKNFMQKF